MSTNHQASLHHTLHMRHRQSGVRVASATLTGCFFGSVLGWTATLAWIGTYAALQVIEYACFCSRRPLFPTLDAIGYPLALVLLALSSIVYGSLSILEVVRMAGWGGGCAAFLLMGSIDATALYSVGSIAAFRASTVPTMVYIAALPLVAMTVPHPPGTSIMIGLMFGGVLAVLGATRIWRDFTSAKDAETFAVGREIAERVANEERLSRLAHLDPLTGLANRTVLRVRLTEIVAAAGPGALLLIDLDGFKYVNDTLGHPAGDRVLQEVAARLLQSSRPGDLVARLGGDEFAIVLPDIEELSTAAAIAERAIAAVARTIIIDGQTVRIGASIGIALSGRHGADADTLFANADLALYRAKAEGRNCLRLYEPGLRAEAIGKMVFDDELRLAFERGEFELFYQPQINLRDGRVTGAETLLRWRHPTRGLLLPALFLPALESGPLAIPVGQWIIENACRQAALWRSQGLTDFTVGVNLFGAQLRTGQLVDKVVSALTRFSLPPEALELEITENIVLRHGDGIDRALGELRALGLGVAFDDYGTGYASLSLLKKYPLSRLKIDRSFVQTICDSPADAAIVRAVVSMAAAFDLRVIAEGVETTAQVELLRQNGCLEVQGYLFGAPMPAAEFERLHVAGQGNVVLLSSLRLFGPLAEKARQGHCP